MAMLGFKMFTSFFPLCFVWATVDGKQRAYLQPEEMLHPNSFSFIHLNIYWAPSTCQSIKCKVFEGIFFREGCFHFFFFNTKIIHHWDFHGGPMVKTPRFHCRGQRFSLWLGNYDPACYVEWPKRVRYLVRCLLQLPLRIVGIWSKLVLQIYDWHITL